MKNRKMISKFGLPILGGAIMTIISIFNSEVRQWLVDHWRILIFLSGLFLFALAIITLWVKSVFNDNIEGINNNFNLIDKRINDLTELSELTAKFSGITNRISRDFIYKEFNKDLLIKALLDDSYTPNELQSYGFDLDFLKEFKIKAHEREIEKTKNLKPDSNEFNRDIE